MPIYEYQCQDCGHRLEALQRMSDDALKDCPQCTKPTLKKLISASGFRLKGGGWYETDFKSANKKNLSEGVTAKKSDTTSSDGAGSGSASGAATSSSQATAKSKTASAP